MYAQELFQRNIRFAPIKNYHTAKAICILQCIMDLEVDVSGRRQNAAAMRDLDINCLYGIGIDHLYWQTYRRCSTVYFVTDTSE